MEKSTSSRDKTERFGEIFEIASFLVIATWKPSFPRSPHVCQLLCSRTAEDLGHWPLSHLPLVWVKSLGRDSGLLALPGLSYTPWTSLHTWNSLPVWSLGQLWNFQALNCSTLDTNTSLHILLQPLLLFLVLAFPVFLPSAVRACCSFSVRLWCPIFKKCLNYHELILTEGSGLRKTMIEKTQICVTQYVGWYLLSQFWTPNPWDMQSNLAS